MNNRRIFLPAIAVLAIVLLAACGHAAPETETAAEPAEAAVSEIPGNSILYYNSDENSAKLVQCFEEGNVPGEAVFMYDQMGSNPEITVTDPEQIKDLYQRLGMVTVAGETDMSVTDCYHYIKFKLADGSYVSYSFEGSDIWCCGEQRCSIENSSKLFRLMKNFTDDYLEGK